MAEQQIPVLSEHQSAKNLDSTHPSEYTPTDDERKAIKLLTGLFEKAKTHRKKYDESWLDYYKMFRGKQWTEQRPSYRHAEVINFIFQSIQSTVPIMTDSRPRFDFLPQEPQDMEFSEILSEVAQSDWERGNWLMRLTETIYDAHFYGTGISDVCFEPGAMNGAGVIGYKAEDPFYVFPDPEAKDFNDEERSCRYVVIAKPVDVDKVKRQYPDKKAFIKPDLIDLMQGDKTDLDQVRFKSPTDNKTIVEGTSAYEVAHKNQALVITGYIFSDEIEEERKEKVNPDGVVEEEFIQKLKYPNGRKIVICNGVLLSDGPNPYDDGLIPLSRLVNYILPREFWGMSEIEQLKGPQKTFNKLVSFALDVLTLMGNPIWKVGTGSGVDVDNLFNRPGLIVEATDISQVQREEGVQLQPYVLQLIDRMAEWFDGISGANDVTRGVRPEGITAASAITSLQEAAQTRIRQKSRNLDAYLQSIGQLYKNRVFQFYTAPRIIRLTNKQGANKYFKFHIENGVDENGNAIRKAIIRNYVEGPSGPKEELEAKEYLLRGDFDVRVSTGSSLPFAKTEKANLGFKLFEAGAIDEPELLDAVDYPNAEAVWERVKQRKLEMAQAAAQARAPQAESASAPVGPPAAA